MSKNVNTNQELAEGIRSGDRLIFERLFRLHYTPLTSYARYILKNPTIAEEMVQEIFLKLWENHSAIIIGISVKAYLYRAVHNHCVNYIKNARINARLSEEAIREMRYHADLALQNFSEELLEKMVTTELEVKLNDAIEKLPPQCREIFQLSRKDDLSYIQIALKLGLSVNTIKTQIMRALERLREVYKKN